MNARSPEELISAYFDGEVSPEERLQAEQLVSSSDEMRQLLDDTAKLSALLHSFPRETAPAGLVVAVQEQVATARTVVPTTAGPGKPTLRREWLAFSAGMLVTMASLLVYVAVEKPYGSDSKSSVAFQTSSVNAPLASDTAMGAHEGIAVEQRFDAIAERRKQVNDLRRSPLAAAAQERGLGVNGESNRYFESLMDPGAEFARESSDLVTVDSPDVKDFLGNLSKGTVIVRQVVDSTSAVALVEFTVVDVKKCAEDLLLLLQKRDVVKADKADDALKAKSVSEMSVAASEKREEQLGRSLHEVELLEDQPGQHGDLIVIYVRAQGDQLAEVFQESLKDHPDLYKRFESQMPIGLPLAAVGPSPVPDLNRDQELKSVDSNQQDSASVLEEGHLAVNTYATSNGMTANALTNSQLGDSFAKRDANENLTAGFATFRVALDHQAKTPSPQKPAASPHNAPAQNFGVINGATVASINSQIPLLQNSTLNQWNAARSRTLQSSADHRDPRLVRMLIVLKPNTLNPAVTH